jgi:hypothetical protein
MQVQHDEGVAIRIDPRPVRGPRQGRHRSVGRGVHRPVIELVRIAGRRRYCEGGKQHGQKRQRERLDNMAKFRFKTLVCLACAGVDCLVFNKKSRDHGVVVKFG